MQRSLSVPIRLLLLSLFCTALACASRPQTVPDDAGGPPDSKTAGERAPITPESVPLALVTPEEFSELMEDPEAKVVLVNVWATWCDPCREEFPDLLRIRKKYEPRGLRVLLLSADFDDEEEDVRDFLAEQGVDFETYLRMGDDHAFIEAVDPNWGGTLPATLVRGPEGQRLLFREGLITFEELDGLLSKHL